MTIKGSCHCGATAFEIVGDIPAPDGSWDGATRRIVVNARLFDDVDAACAEIAVIDGKHLW
jgi:hypothetical protein